MLTAPDSATSKLALRACDSDLLGLLAAPGTVLDAVLAGLGVHAGREVAARPRGPGRLPARVQVAPPLRVGLADRQRRLELVVAQQRAGVDHAVLTIVDGDDQQVDVAHPLVQHAAGVA